MQSRYEDPGKWRAALLALLMHGLLALALVISVHWQTRPFTIEAEIWVPAAAEPEEPAKARPLPKPTPEPPRIKPTAAQEVTPPAKPDIKLKSPAVKPKVEPRKAPVFDDLLARENAQIDRRKIEQQQLLREEQEARLLAQARADMEAQRLAGARRQAQLDYQSKLSGKIRGNIVRPPNLTGNPVAQFAVTQLPSGEVIEVRRTRSSGNVQWDQAVERAILKSSPLPRPDDPSVFARDLNLTFCPDEEKGCRQ